MLPQTPYNDGLGICFDFTQYTYDHDANAGTPNRAVPSCASLPSKNAPPTGCTVDAMGACSGTGCVDGCAHEWGCWNTTDSGVTFANTKGHVPTNKLGDFKVGGFGTGTGVRHKIVQ
jgi:hypothetical protein